jgi:hypothetical protein
LGGLAFRNLNSDASLFLSVITPASLERAHWVIGEAGGALSVSFLRQQVGCYCRGLPLRCGTWTHEGGRLTCSCFLVFVVCLFVCLFVRAALDFGGQHCLSRCQYIVVEFVAKRDIAICSTDTTRGEREKDGGNNKGERTEGQPAGFQYTTDGGARVENKWFEKEKVSKKQQWRWKGERQWFGQQRHLFGDFDRNARVFCLGGGGGRMELRIPMGHVPWNVSLGFHQSVLRFEIFLDRNCLVPTVRAPPPVTTTTSHQSPPPAAAPPPVTTNSNTDLFNLVLFTARYGCILFGVLNGGTISLNPTDYIVDERDVGFVIAASAEKVQVKKYCCALCLIGLFCALLCAIVLYCAENDWLTPLSPHFWQEMIDTFSQAELFQRNAMMSKSEEARDDNTIHGGGSGGDTFPNPNATDYRSKKKKKRRNSNARSLRRKLVANGGASLMVRGRTTCAKRPLAMLTTHHHHHHHHHPPTHYRCEQKSNAPSMPNKTSTNDNGTATKICDWTVVPLKCPQGKMGTLLLLLLLAF